MVTVDVEKIQHFNPCTAYRLGDRVLYHGDILVLGPSGFYKAIDGTDVALPAYGGDV